MELNFDKILNEIFAITDPKSADLQEAAQNYLINAGLSNDDMVLLGQKITGK